MTSVALAVLALLAAVVVTLLAARKAPSPPRLLAFLMMALGGLFSLCMLVVTFALSYQVWIDVEAATGPGRPGFASAAPLTPASGGGRRADADGGSAIANAMTAIGTVVAVVALILSLGTSWFASLLQQVQHTHERLQQEERRRREERERERAWSRLVQRTDEALLLAKAALMPWVEREGSSDPVNLVQNWALQLEMLRADDREIRGRAFEALQVLAPQGPGDAVDPLLAPVARYTELCHALALHRLGEAGDGSPPSAQALARAVDQGLWCLLFDPIERARWARELSR